MHIKYSDAEQPQISDLRAIITAVERGAVHDGHGFRTTVFFKGCPLRCGWCHNPETHETTPQLLYTQSKCAGCHACAATCRRGALVWENDGLEIDFDRCDTCGECVKTCPTGAMLVVGEEKTLDDLVREVLRDQVFYKNSGGGVTLSGGELSLQADFAAAFLKKLKEAGIHTAIETCAHTSGKKFASLIKYTDTVLFDLKHSDSEKHRKYTGCGNELILKNLELTRRMCREIIVRVPLIPGVNDGIDVLEGICRICLRHDIKMLNLLPFHQLGEAKWDALQKEYPFRGVKTMASADIMKARDICASMGLNVSIGGSAL